MVIDRMETASVKWWSQTGWPRGARFGPKGLNFILCTNGSTLQDEGDFRHQRLKIKRISYCIASLMASLTPTSCNSVYMAFMTPTIIGDTVARSKSHTPSFAYGSAFSRCQTSSSLPALRTCTLPTMLGLSEESPAVGFGSLRVGPPMVIRPALT